MRWRACLDLSKGAGTRLSPHDIAAPFGYCLAPMLHINDLTYRIEGRIIFDKATAGIPAGHKVGFVGRNGSGKTTLLRLIAGELHPDDGGINVPRSTRIGWVAQEAPGGPESLIEFVLAADTERARLLAEAETAHDPGRIADIHERLTDIGAHAAPARAARILAGLGFDEAAQQRPCAEYLRRLAHARGARRHAVHRARPAAARRAHQLSRPRRHAVARRLPARLPAHRADRQPRPRAAEPLRHARSCISRRASSRSTPAATTSSRRRGARSSASTSSSRRSRTTSAAISRRSSPASRPRRRRPARRRAASRRWPACSRSPSRSRSASRRSCSPTRRRRLPARSSA